MFTLVANVIRTILVSDYYNVREIKGILFDLLVSITKEDEKPKYLVAQANVVNALDAGDNLFPSRFRIIMRSPSEGEREVYCLDGKVTHSKIFAIKYVRSLNNARNIEPAGLKDCKDYVEALPLFISQDEIRL